MLHQLCHDAVQCTHYKGTVTHAPCHGPSYALPPSLVPGRTFSSNFPTSVSYKPQRQAQPVTRIVHDDKWSTISVIAIFTQTSNCPCKKPHGLTPPPSIAALAWTISCEAEVLKNPTLPIFAKPPPHHTTTSILLSLPCHQVHYYHAITASVTLEVNVA